MLLLSALWWLRLSKRLDGRLWWWVELTVAVAVRAQSATPIIITFVFLSKSDSSHEVFFFLTFLSLRSLTELFFYSYPPSHLFFLPSGLLCDQYSVEFSISFTEFFSSRISVWFFFIIPMSLVKISSVNFIPEFTELPEFSCCSWNFLITAILNPLSGRLQYSKP